MSNNQPRDMNEKMRVDMAEILPIVEEQLQAGKEVCFSPNGVSMLPFIRPGRDSVFLKSPPEKIKKYDILLYRRRNGQFVLHRVVGFQNGSFVMCGDNQYLREYGINPGQVIGIVERFSHDGREVVCRSRQHRMRARLHTWKQFWYGIFKRIKATVKSWVK